ncbi:hypothetical protein LEMLEM_LOCUS8157 [Lemmus lemmus]
MEPVLPGCFHPRVRVISFPGTFQVFSATMRLMRYLAFWTEQLLGFQPCRLTVKRDSGFCIIFKARPPLHPSSHPRISPAL